MSEAKNVQGSTATGATAAAANGVSSASPGVPTAPSGTGTTGPGLAKSGKKSGCEMATHTRGSSRVGATKVAQPAGKGPKAAPKNAATPKRKEKKSKKEARPTAPGKENGEKKTQPATAAAQPNPTRVEEEHPVFFPQLAPAAAAAAPAGAAPANAVAQEFKPVVTRPAAANAPVRPDAQLVKLTSRDRGYDEDEVRWKVPKNGVVPPGYKREEVKDGPRAMDFVTVLIRVGRPLFTPPQVRRQVVAPKPSAETGIPQAVVATTAVPEAGVLDASSTVPRAAAKKVDASCGTGMEDVDVGRLEQSMRYTSAVFTTFQPTTQRCDAAIASVFDVGAQVDLGELERWSNTVAENSFRDFYLNRRMTEYEKQLRSRTDAGWGRALREARASCPKATQEAREALTAQFTSVLPDAGKAIFTTGDEDRFRLLRKAGSWLWNKTLFILGSVGVLLATFIFYALLGPMASLVSGLCGVAVLFYGLCTKRKPQADEEKAKPGVESQTRHVVTAAIALASLTGRQSYEKEFAAHMRSLIRSCGTVPAAVLRSQLASEVEVQVKLMDRDVDVINRVVPHAVRRKEVFRELDEMLSDASPTAPLLRATTIIIVGICVFASVLGATLDVQGSELRAHFSALACFCRWMDAGFCDYVGPPPTWVDCSADPHAQAYFTSGTTRVNALTGASLGLSVVVMLILWCIRCLHSRFRRQQRTSVIP